MLTSIDQIEKIFSLCGLSTCLILGTLGNFFLACIILQRTHRRNSCSLYLLATTIVNFILIQCILPLAIYSASNADPQNVSLIWCKVRSYLFNTLLMLYRWYKMAACVDRAAMCSRHASIRSLSQTRIAYKVILLITFAWILIPTHIIICFQIESDQCVPQSGAYASFYTVYSIVISGWSPPIVMTVLGVLSYRNLKQIRNRRFSISTDTVLVKGHPITTKYHYISKRDQQLIVLLICEVVLYVGTNLLYSINLTYQAITSNQIKSMERIRIESFISYLSTLVLVIINSCSTFYLYFLISNKFRQDFRNLLKRFYLCDLHVNRSSSQQRRKLLAVIAYKQTFSYQRNY